MRPPAFASLSFTLFINFKNEFKNLKIKVTLFLNLKIKTLNYKHKAYSRNLAIWVNVFMTFAIIQIHSITMSFLDHRNVFTIKPFELTMLFKASFLVYTRR